jgi:K+-transporting ATPase KdpF subunit
MDTAIVLSTSSTFETTSVTGYGVGAIIALLLLAYLFYSLFKPEKF